MSPPGPFPAERVPEVVFEDEPGFAALHRRAWELAWEHVVAWPGAPRSPYMDEAHTPGVVWIWDTCFMALFCKYAPDVFPGVESLENFYRPLHDGAPTRLRIHHLDNPPLFAWVEWEHFTHTGDLDRLRRVYEARWLQRHFDLVERLPLPEPPPCSPNETFLRRVLLGYHWAGCCSGMDNTPRGGGGAAPGPRPDDSRHGYPDILWLDALAQQALAADRLARIAGALGDAAGAEAWRARHRERADLLNDRYWDERDGIYHDIRAAAPHAFFRVKTPAAYWPLLAGACPPERARRLAAHAADPAVFGGPAPFPSVARDEPSFDPDGGYWRGGVWLPLACMACRALAENGFAGLAADAAERLVRHMLAAWRAVEPHTIWEAYAPVAPRPATGKRPDRIVRPDFCGWSALGPISMLVEHVLGLACDGRARTVTWRLRRDRGPHGVRRLRFGRVTASLLYDGRGAVEVETDTPFTLRVDGQRFDVPPGARRLPLAPLRPADPGSACPTKPLAE